MMKLRDIHQPIGEVAYSFSSQSPYGGQIEEVSCLEPKKRPSDDEVTTLSTQDMSYTRSLFAKDLALPRLRAQ